jgi:uncharacterized protein (TIGR02246 family)
MMRKLISHGVIVSTLLFIVAYAEASNGEESAIRQVIEQRRLAWNAQDTRGYATLLANDADIVSSTGRSAQGREEIIKLYVDQRAGAYRTATITSTVVKRIKFVRPDIALADAEAELEGARGPDGGIVAPTRSLVFFILTKEGGRWLISSIRGAPISAIQSSKQ